MTTQTIDFASPSSTPHGTGCDEGSICFTIDENRILHNYKTISIPLTDVVAGKLSQYSPTPIKLSQTVPHILGIYNPHSIRLSEDSIILQSYTSVPIPLQATGHNILYDYNPTPIPLKSIKADCIPPVLVHYNPKSISLSQSGSQLEYIWNIEKHKTQSGKRLLYLTTTTGKRYGFSEGGEFKFIIKDNKMIINEATETETVSEIEFVGGEKITATGRVGLSVQSSPKHEILLISDGHNVHNEITIMMGHKTLAPGQYPLALLPMVLYEYTPKSISLANTKRKKGILEQHIPISIQLKETRPLLPGEYTTYTASATTDHSFNSITTSTEIDAKLTDYKDKCGADGDSELISALNNENAGIQDILIKLIRKQNNISCCDNVDLSNHVLKTSIVPCSNVIPDKYKKYGEKYNPNVQAEDTERPEDQDLHPSRIHDKFSIGYISLISLIGIIIKYNK